MTKLTNSLQELKPKAGKSLEPKRKQARRVPAGGGGQANGKASKSGSSSASAGAAAAAGKRTAAVIARKPMPVAVAPVVPAQEEESEFTVEEDLYPAAPAAAASEVAPRKLSTTEVLRRVLQGHRRDPAATTPATIAEQPVVDDYVQPDQLLEAAHGYFKKYNASEKQRLKDASKRLAQMRRINDQGGDADGFKFVLPKNAKRLAEAMTTGGAVGVKLESHFGGDGVEESENAPSRRKTRKGHRRDDFYQFQVYQKWTKNAENFLRRGHLSRGILTNKRTARSL